MAQLRCRDESLRPGAVRLMLKVFHTALRRRRPTEPRGRGAYIRCEVIIGGARAGVQTGAADQRLDRFLVRTSPIAAHVAQLIVCQT